MSAGADPRATCIIGVARHTWHPSDVGDDGAPEPLDMWEEVARSAASDAGTSDGAGILRSLESVDVVYSQSWQYDDAVQRLSERLGASPSRRHYSGIGGSVPIRSLWSRRVRSGGATSTSRCSSVRRRWQRSAA